MAKRAKEIFEQIVDAPEAEREGLLLRLCEGDGALLGNVKSLIRAWEKSPRFLEAPTGDGGGSALRDAAAAAARLERPGEMVGRYKLLELIGEGGFGLVYMAEQREPVVRRVALKIIKAGMDTRSVIARFEAERQALAMMDHPNIAKVFDAGESAAGRPFFVMELVRGEPITQFCDREGLGLNERLALFADVCRAVQHAHQRGVIHRDIKPGNVLVTVADGKPLAKVIDFGIAKAMNTRLTEKTLFTEFRQLIGTPEYMSPEQADSGGVDVDTRTDVYSLGVLLYELLSGSTPFDGARLRSASYAEIQRIIREEEPKKPSTRLSASGKGLAAARRRLGPEELRRLVKGELDWIVMRCLDKDRARRYDSASGLAADVERFLRGEPVEAAPPSLGYALRKFTRRNRVAVGFAAVAAAGLLLTAAGTSVGMWRAGVLRDEAILAKQRAEDAEREQARLRAEAQNEAERAVKSAEEAKRQGEIAKAINRLINDTLAKADRAQQGGRDDVTVREVMDEMASELDTGGRATSPEVEAGLRTTIGMTYRALGVFDNAEKQLLRAEELRNSAAPASRDALETRLMVATLRRDQGKLVESRDALAKLVAEMRGMETPPRDVFESSLVNLGTLLWDMRELEEARRILLEAKGMREARAAETDTATYEKELGSILNQLALVEGERGDHETAVRYFGKSLDIARRHMGRENLRIAVTLSNMAGSLDELGRLGEAEDTLVEALRIRRKLQGDNHPDLVATMSNLAGIRASRGDLRGAIEMRREALSLARGSLPPEHPNLAVLLNNLALDLDRAGEGAEAEAMGAEAVQIFRKVFPPEHPSLAGVLANHAALASKVGKHELAISELREAEKIVRARLKPDQHQFYQTLIRLSEVLDRAGQPAEAAAARAELLRIAETLPTESKSRGLILSVVGQQLLGLGQPADAEPVLRAAVAVRLIANPPGSEEEWRLHHARSMHGETLVLLADAARRAGNAAEAKRLALEGLRLTSEGYQGLSSAVRVPPGEGNEDRRQTARDRLLRALKLADELDPGQGHGERAGALEQKTSGG